MGSVETNLRKLTPSRKKLRPGDVFVAQPPDGLYVFGRVIFVDLPNERAPMPGSNLIYLYRHRSFDKAPDRAALDPEDLLLPPLFINRLPWSRGYFETVAHWPLEPGDLREQHCFLRAINGAYLNELGEPLPGPIEPVGDWGLHSFRTVDDAISEALGFDPVPVD